MVVSCFFENFEGLGELGFYVFFWGGWEKTLEGLEGVRFCCFFWGGWEKTLEGLEGVRFCCFFWGGWEKTLEGLEGVRFCCFFWGGLGKNLGGWVLFRVSLVLFCFFLENWDRWLGPVRFLWFFLGGRGVLLVVSGCSHVFSAVCGGSYECWS